MKKPRFINGCSKSVSLVSEFERLGWDAWTCDLQSSEGWDKHIQDDIMNHLDDGWDFGVFHTDCTHLANSGVRWRVERNEMHLVKQDAYFFNAVDSGAKFPHVMENPIQHKYAREYIRKYDQLIQPHHFGEYESKAICLWLVGAPKLVRTHWIPKELIRQSVWREAPGEERKANRSRNFPLVSKAMAEQWGNLGIG